ncbi:hypothetical protein BD309DRAFT_988049 [Dichomitus squalens]|uniref:Uncharacterized protein n=1 Tax=Dichomitus squalens TaxID=114155 RepID=A0A4Q9P5Z0_9APHY|nr:hypothetical protein BD309DRAFT_988049 [Dichomitus squalens]TBU57659.1 hypothetical protein BD310DRAFT_1019172 [Dichomitus squalens]
MTANTYYSYQHNLKTSFPTHSSNMTAPLERGKACSRCRLRCDGQRPACGQCVRSERAEDCEYLDGPGPTQNQLLEGEIARLEGQIARLSAGSAPVTLHDPYAAWYQAQRNAQTQQNANDPTRTLIQHFVRHATEFGFFLDISRFLDKVFTHSPSRSQSMGILLKVIYLIGAKLSNVPQMLAQEQAYLTRALQVLPTALPEDPRSAIYVMQAEVLLANYFFNNNRQLEGVYHTNAAVSIAMASKLHIIRSAGRSRSGDSSTYRLPPPADALEEGERINGFWTVFVMDRCWAVASGSTPAFTDDEASGTQIDTPWPMELSRYQSHPLPSDLRTRNTVRSFIAGSDSDANMTGQSLLAIHAKAAILYESAARLASRYNPYELASQASFLSLDNRIERFKQALPRIEQFDPSRADFVRQALLTHTLAHCATIQLHTPLVQQGVTANSRTCQAAHAAVRNLNSRHVSSAPILYCVNPFNGILWPSVARVLSQGISTARRQRAAGASGSSQGMPDEGTLQSDFQRVVAVMNQNAAFSPLMSMSWTLLLCDDRMIHCSCPSVLCSTGTQVGTLLPARSS